MKDTTVSVTRKGSVLQRGVAAVIENQSVQMAGYYNSGHPYDVYNIYINYATMDFQRGDLITDEVNPDPTTGSLAVYRVIGTPRAYMDGHVELVGDGFVGKN